MRTETIILTGSNNERDWTIVARIRQRTDFPLPTPAEFKSPWRYHRYQFQEPDPALPNGLPEKKPLDGTWGWR